MKKSIIAAVLMAAITFPGFAQEDRAESTPANTIHATGRAAKSVQADFFRILITLNEYKAACDGQVNEVLVPMKDVEKKFFDILKEFRIESKNVETLTYQLK